METDPISNPASVTALESGRSSPSRRVKSKILDFHHRYEKYTEITIFGVGFVWDSFTMTRVDSLIDNIILLFYLVIIAAMIVLTLRKQCGISLPARIQKYESHFLYAMQFCFGGLFSSYVIFYFKSASWSRTQFFFLFLVFLWIANEFLHHRLRNPDLLAILYSFCLLSFLAFFLPVVLSEVNMWIFLLAGFLSVLISLSVFYLGLRVPRDGWKRRVTPIAGWIGGVVVSVNILYFFNLIPPVPLALKNAEIYHSIVKTQEGYLVEYVHPSLWQFWKESDSPFYLSPGEKIYCYTAIFAPGKLRAPVRHVWSRKTPDGWVQTDAIRFDISGGREGGYRGYTFKRGVTPGKWRVQVETVVENVGGLTLGQITFDVVASPDPHPLLQSRLIR